MVFLVVSLSRGHNFNECLNKVCFTGIHIGGNMLFLSVGVYCLSLNILKKGFECKRIFILQGNYNNNMIFYLKNVDSEKSEPQSLQ